MTVFKLPDLGEGLAEAEILRWHVKVGEHVEADQPMLSVETAKAVVEVPAPTSGTVLALRRDAGERIEVGTPLIEFQPDSPQPPAVSAPAAVPPEGAPAQAAAGSIVGHMPEAPVSAAQPASARAPATARPRAVPAARGLARTLGVDLARVRGSGRGGLITPEDVLSAHSAAGAVGTGAGTATGNAAPEIGDGRSEALRSLRRSMAQNMTLARDSVMESAVFDDADLHRWGAGNDYTARVLRAIAAGARAEPALNAWYEATLQSRTLFEHVDVGIAVDTEEGLLVPVIRHVEQRSIVELRAEVERLKRAARERTVRTEELRHFTFMFSNFGMMAGRYATPVIVPPAVAILGTGRVGQDVLAIDGRVEVHRRMPLSLSFDHRVVTGAEAVRFLAAVIHDLELPE